MVFVRFPRKQLLKKQKNSFFYFCSIFIEFSTCMTQDKTFVTFLVGKMLTGKKCQNKRYTHCKINEYKISQTNLKATKILHF